jgi:dienelactone hydrolase
MPKEDERTRDRSTSSQMTDAIDWAIAQNNDKASPYYGKLDVKEIAVSGMSCGGLQALEAAPDPRVTTTVICNSGILANPGGGNFYQRFIFVFLLRSDYFVQRVAYEM